MNAIHEALVVALHVQSRVVSMVTVLVVPAAGAAPVIAFETVTSHFIADGDVISIELDLPPQAAARTRAAHAPNSRARMAERKQCKRSAVESNRAQPRGGPRIPLRKPARARAKLDMLDRCDEI